MSVDVLVVDDDPPVRRLVEQTFSRSGYRVRAVGSGSEALDELQRAEPDLVVLDIMMPGMNGVELCRRIRAVSSVPIILLTGQAESEDIVGGLQAGADDYVTKPFSPLELVARAEANLRRRELDTSQDEPRAVSFGEGRFVLDLGSRVVRLDGREVPLTPREFSILGYLAVRAGRVVPHDDLIQHVWGSPDHARLTDLRTYVKLIRRKIEPDPGNPRYLLSRSGSGYMLPTADQ